MAELKDLMMLTFCSLFLAIYSSHHAHTVENGAYKHQCYGSLAKVFVFFFLSFETSCRCSIYSFGSDGGGRKKWWNDEWPSTISTNDFIQSHWMCTWLLGCTKRQKSVFDCCSLWIKMDRKCFQLQKKKRWKKNRISNAIASIELVWIGLDWNDGSQTAKRRKITFLRQVINSENWIYFSPSVIHFGYHSCVLWLCAAGEWWRLRKNNAVDILFIGSL